MCSVILFVFLFLCLLVWPLTVIWEFQHSEYELKYHLVVNHQIRCLVTQYLIPDWRRAKNVNDFLTHCGLGFGAAVSDRILSLVVPVASLAFTRLFMGITIAWNLYRVLAILSCIHTHSPTFDQNVLRLLSQTLHLPCIVPEWGAFPLALMVHLHYNP